jgi:hypothetical protein
LAEADLKDDPDAQAALALLALVAGQDVEPAEGSDGNDGRWRIVHRVAPERVVSTVDPDARDTRKSPENRRDGYRAHVGAEPETGIITDEELTQATGPANSDAAVAAQFLEAELREALINMPFPAWSAADGSGRGQERVWEWLPTSALGPCSARRSGFGQAGAMPSPG